MSHQVKLLQLFNSRLLLSKHKEEELKSLQMEWDHFEQWLKEQQLELLNQIDINCSIPGDIPEDAYKNRFSDYSPLHVVVVMANLDLVNELIKRGANLVKQEAHDQCTPLHLALRHITYGKEITYLCKDQHRVIDALLSAQIHANNAVNPKRNDGMSHFHIACLSNHTAAVQFFIDSGESIDQMTNEGLTPLHWAIKSFSFDTIKILLTNGADVYLKDTNGASSLILLTKLMIEANDLMTIGKRVPTIVYEEDINEIESIFMLICELKMADPIFLDNAELTIVHIACMLKNKLILKSCLEKGYDFNRSLPKDSKFWPGWTPLHFAACCSVESIDLLLQNGANINAKNEKGETFLDLCSMRYAPKIMTKILSRTDELQSIKFSDGSSKLLDVLQAMNNHDKFGKLLSSFPRVDISLPLDSVIWPGFNLLHLSLLINDKTKEFDKYSNSRKVDVLDSEDEKNWNCTEYEVALYMKRIKMCLEKGCNVAMKNADGLTPIHVAFKMQNYKVANELLSFCQEDVLDPNGLSHFHIACALGHQDAVECLLSKGVNVNHPVEHGFEWYKMGKYSNVTHFSVKAQATPLHIAVTLKNNKLVQRLVENGADIFAKDARGLNPVHLSLFSNRILAKWLLHKALKNLPSSEKIVSPNGFSYLFVAVYANDSKAIKRLLECGEQVDVVWPTDLEFVSGMAGLTPLHVAVNMCSDGVVRTLIKAGANIFADNPNREYDSPLQRAFDKPKIFKYFVQKLRRDGTSIAALDSSGMTQLHVACRLFHLEWAKDLLKMGADANAIMLQSRSIKDDKTVLRVTPLCAMIVQAVHVVEGVPRNFMDLLQLLIEHGADVTIDYDGLTPLQLVYKEYRREVRHVRFQREQANDYHHTHAHSPACSYGYETEDENDLEIEHETDDESDTEDELTELDDMVSKASSFYETALKINDLLVSSQKSYGVNPTTEEGYSHFHYACSRDKVEIVKKFLNNGVDINHMTSFFFDERPGYSPLHFALAYHCGKVASLLIERGADVKAEDAEGNTPLHVAIIRKFIDLPLFDKLLGKGANINAKNIAGETPVKRLSNRRRLTLDRLEFLIDRGAKIDVSNSDSAIKLIDAAIKHAKPSDVISVYKMLLKACDPIEFDIKHSFNAIHSLVSIYDENRTLDFYLDAIKQFMELGFELEWRDKSGLTPLHSASVKYVYPAVEALLILGANINTVSRNGDPPLTRHRLKDYDDEESMWYYGNRPDVTNDKLVAHAFKMKLVNLDVLDAVAKAVEVAMKTRKSYVYRNKDIVDKRICQEELKKIENTTIGQILPLKNFLSEWGAVIDYPTMPFVYREVIDKYFIDTDSLRKEFPQFCGLLMLQYRKALQRVDLLQSAKHIIVSECEIELPDLVLEAIFRYFKNDDLRFLIAPDKCNKRDKYETKAAVQYNPEILDYHNECRRLATISFDSDYDLDWYDDDSDSDEEY